LLPNIDKSEQRGVIEAEITLPEMKQPLLLLATHFDFRRDERERLESVKVINELAAMHAARPALLAGDLNATPESMTLEQLATNWKLANAEPLPTIPVKEPQKQIDYVLYRPLNRWKVVEVKVLEEAVASDHRAIAATLELLPGETP
jgi:endonuclease/exonuclease/phosphatase family metal-dependent hydrolase